MRQYQDLYTVLGVAPDADATTIRARYRQLVREYHPDIAADKLAAHERLVEIVDAYQILRDEQRRQEYDRARRARDRAAAAPKFSWEEELRRHSTEALIVVAELFFIRGQVSQAVAECRRIISMDPQNAAAYGLLGEILGKSGHVDEAVRAYTMAVQFAPHPQIYQRKLDLLLQGAQEDEREVPMGHPGSRVVRGMGMAALAMASGLLVIVFMAPDRMALWVGHLPETTVVLCASATAFFAGVGMALLRWVGHVDEELFGVSLATPGGVLPVGVLLLASSLASFYLSIVSYVVIALMEETMSWSIVKAMGMAALIVAAFALLLSDHMTKVLLWGGNLIFPSLLVGWSLGSMGRPRW